MKIKLRNQYCGPSGVYKPGAELDLPSAEARQLIDGGYAEAVKATAATKKRADKDESADADDNGDSGEQQ